MKTMKNFTISKKEINDDTSIAVFTDENGNDWYESQKEFAADTLKIMFDKNGIIIAASYDVSMLAPGGLSVTEVAQESVPDDFSDSMTSYAWDGKEISPRTYSSDELQAQAESHRQNMLTDANSTISLWQTELFLGSISDDDKAGLIKWMAYIKALKAMDFTSITDEVAYKAISWPEQPQA